jgi:hypothetical protein
MSAIPDRVYPRLDRVAAAAYIAGIHRAQRTAWIYRARHEHGNREFCAKAARDNNHDMLRALRQMREAA